MGPDPSGRTKYWWTQCSCGREQATQHRSLRNGTSAGCIRCKGGGTGWYVSEQGRLPIPGADIPEAPRCSTCGESKCVMPTRGLVRGWYWKCKPCDNQIKKGLYRQSSEFRKRLKVSAIRRKCGQYGLTPDEADTLWNRQGRKCGICCDEIGSPTACAAESKATHIDHCHDSGEVRGLLCSKCNQGLGLLGDNVAGLEAAIRYLSAIRPALA